MHSHDVYARRSSTEQQARDPVPTLHEGAPPVLINLALLVRIAPPNLAHQISLGPAAEKDLAGPGALGRGVCVGERTGQVEGMGRAELHALSSRTVYR